MTISSRLPCHADVAMHRYSSSAPVVLSNEVLLRSKIAQLDSKREAASGVTGLRKPFPTSSSGGVGRTAVKHAVGGGTFDGKTRHLSDAAEDHSDFGRGPGKREVSTSNFRGGRGLAKNEEKLLRQFETQVPICPSLCLRKSIYPRLRRHVCSWRTTHVE